MTFAYRTCINALSALCAIALVSTAGIVPQAGAQSGNGAALSAQQAGRIVGRIIDEASGQGLSDVMIQVVGTSMGAQSGLDGRFVVSGIPAGAVELLVRRIGYQPKRVTDVIVEAGQIVAQDISLSSADFASTLEAVTVTASAERGTVSRALDEQRSSSAITSAITAEQISRSTDGDAGAAAQRISGVTVEGGKYVSVRGLGERYTVTSLNGSRIPSPEPERRIVPLDLFPSGLLQSITTAKTFTPNLSGDFSGAQVDIRTREFPTQRQWSTSFSTGFNTAATGSTLPMAPRVGREWLAAATGPRSIPLEVRNTPRPQPGAQTNAMVNSMRNAWSVVDERGAPSLSLGTSVGGNDDVFGRTIGYLVSGTYSRSDEVNAGTVRENPQGDRYEGNLGRQSVLLGGLFNASTMVGRSSRISLNNTWNRSADNEAQIETGRYENHATTVQIERLRYVERYVMQNQIAAEHQLSHRQRLDWSASVARISRQEPDRSEYVTWLDPEIPTWYNQEGAFRAYGGLKERASELSANWQLALDPAWTRLLRAGVLARSTDRDAYDAGYAIRTREWAPDDQRWTLTPEEFFDGRFSSNGEALFEVGTFNAGGNYSAKDRLVAGYAMVEWRFTPSVRFTGGARLEKSDLEIAYEDVLANRGTAAPDYLDVLPSAALAIDLSATQQLRLSASQTLSRPEYREIAPICYRAGLGEEQRCGNPDLVRTLIRNYDLRWEHYPLPGEMFAVAVFGKQFTDPIEPRYQGRSGTNSLWFQNAKSATSYGVEVEALRALGNLTPALEQFTSFVNATLIRSSVQTGVEGDPERAMTGQAPYVVNTGVTWNSRSYRSSATVLFNVVGDRIINARPSGQAVADSREIARPSLDLAIRFPAPMQLSGKLDVRNILDSPYEVRQGELQRAWYRSGRSVSLGFSWQQ